MSRFAATILVLALSACDRATPLPTPPAPPPTLAGLRPLTYFEDNCSRCHGPYGSFYGDTFGKKLTPEQLHRVVDEMAAGPGNAPLQGAELEAQVAYHRSLIDGKPFLILTEIKEENGQHILHGEATPDSQVELLINDVPTPAKLEGHRWSIPLPSLNFSQLSIRATKDGHTTTLNPTRIYSH